MNFEDSSLPSSSSDEYNFSNNFSRMTEKDDPCDSFLPNLTNVDPSELISNDNGFVVLESKTSDVKCGDESFISWVPFYTLGDYYFLIKSRLCFRNKYFNNFN